MIKNLVCAACGRRRKPSHEKRIHDGKPYNPECASIHEWRKTLFELKKIQKEQESVEKR